MSIDKPAPRLLIELPLEGDPVIRRLAETAEDEARLLAWASRSHALRELGRRVLDALDADERGAA